MPLQDITNGTPSPSTSTGTSMSRVSTTPLPDVATPSLTSSEVLETPKPIKKGKKRAASSCSDSIHLEVSKIDSQIAKLLEEDNEMKDEAFHLAMGWAARYRQLSSYQQAIARAGVEAAMFKAEFETPSESPLIHCNNKTYTSLDSF